MWFKPAVIVGCATLTGLGLSGCGLAPGLTGASTCTQFNDASVDAQRKVIQKLVVDAENGRSNPMREANAIMQITYTCQSKGAGDVVLSDIAI